MEIELQKAIEELAREEEKEAEEARKEGGRRREIAVSMDIIRRGKENVARLVTRDGEDRNLRMRNQEATLESAGLKASQHSTTAGTHNTPPVNAYSLT